MHREKIKINENWEIVNKNGHGTLVNVETLTV